MHLSKNHLNWDHLAVIAFELHQDILNVQIYNTLHYITLTMDSGFVISSLYNHTLRGLEVMCLFDWSVPVR